jgi:peroxiredoxin
MASPPIDTNGENRFKYALLIVLFSILGGAWIIFSQETVVQSGPVQGLTTGPQAGFLAPEFTLQTVDGNQVSLTDLRGQPVILNFWATWCPPCRIEMPHLQQASQKYEGRATILGIDQRETIEEVAAFASEHDLTFPLLMDEDGAVNNIYGVRGLPTTFFVDKDGVIVENFTGILNQAILEDRLDELLTP